MVKKRNGIVAATVLLGALALSSAPMRQSAVLGGPRGIHPYLFKSVSRKNLVETARDHQWSIQFVKTRSETLHVVAIRIEFARDTSLQTTGNGLFGIRLGGDKEEDNYYKNDTTYRYDDLPHDSIYFARQLDAVKKYFAKVSRGNLTLEYSIYPAGYDQTGYAVAHPMPFYSPGGKRRKESYDEYYERRTIGLITFVRDALQAADANRGKSPFANLRYDPSDRTIRDDRGRTTVFLIFHAGASYLTDGGEQGGLGQDTPSDMIDAFITRDWFKYYRDTLKLSQDGVMVAGNEGQFPVDEVMMCSETSNQDGLNWGIQGIIVNQIARQLGIPDLFSTSSGISGIGSFCIMDFAGYSAGNGFIPPYPCAWVRAFMGWDRVYAASMGEARSYQVKALTSVIDRDTSGTFTNVSDTTILLVPINDHEYYLIENRQRNLSGNEALFRHDTIETEGDDSIVISNYPYVADIDSLEKYNFIATSGKNASNVIQRVRNNDIGTPASGLLVWHVDERIIRDRLAYNAVNADSLFRGVSLVEADGITDLGIMFQDIFYQAAFDYGGAEDVFPHRTVIQDNNTVINVTGFGPMSRPSTRANDGGHTYLELGFTPSQSKPRTEPTALGKNDGYHFVTNYSDSVFTVNVSWNYLAASWPRLAAPGRYFDPLFVDIDKSEPGSELFLLDHAGRAYLWSADTTMTKRYNDIPVSIDRIGLRNDTLSGADTAFCFDSVPNACAMPSAINGIVFVPSREKKIYFYTGGEPNAPLPRKSTIALNDPPSSYVCNYRDSSWAIGCSNGRVVFGTMRDTVRTVALASGKPICALAALRESGSTIVAVQTDGRLSLVGEQGANPDSSVLLPEVALPPFCLVTGDLDDDPDDNTSEIVVTDSRHGMWVYGRDLRLAPGWEEEPTDWPSYYRIDTTDRRERFPVNLAPPALADIDRDGYLDILIGGTNGLYAFNYKGAMKSGWPAFLDKRSTRWYQRGSVVSSPVIVTDAQRRPLVLFSSITGENLTFRFSKVTGADREKGIVWFLQESGALDSITGLSSGFIDTTLEMNDSIIGPYTIPGGILDAVGANAKRPGSVIASTLQSHWPLTAGAPLNTSPLVGFMDADSTPDLIAVSANGWVYRWELGKSILPESLFWPQTGYGGGRSFAFGGNAVPPSVSKEEPITFFSFPNPTRGAEQVTFKYRFNAPATGVRLDIYSYTGFKVYSNTTMGAPPRNLTGSYPDWNILVVSVKKDLKDLGPGVYRCRLEATINGKKHHRTWKMAVIR
ncbi:MAG: hypothetical protein JW913_08525 [Chitinispirillaceae bacterium]|nr:hypothetical protein [Chitinispirillaceae bacterium]